MDERDKKPLTIDDILNQLVKPSVIQAPTVSTSKPIPPIAQSHSLPTVPQIKKSPGEIRLPQLGGEKAAAPEISSEPETQPAEVEFLVRTMADDVARLRQGQKPTAVGIEKTLSPPAPRRPPTPIPPPLPSSMPFKPPTSRPLPLPSELDSLTPPIFPFPVPIVETPFQPPPSPIPTTKEPATKTWSLFKSKTQKTEQLIPPSPTEKAKKEPRHYHEEYIVSPFSEAKKKQPGQEEERVEYGVIAKIVGRGMTTGVMFTLIGAFIAYGLFYFFLLRGEVVIISQPTPTKTPKPQAINELENIFGGISSTNFKFPEDQSDTSTLRLFQNHSQNQSIKKKDFLKVNFLTSLGQQQILSLVQFFDQLGIKYPSGLRDTLKINSIVLIYSQQELFAETGELIAESTEIAKKLVLITEVNDPEKTREIVKNWEQTAPNDLKDIFQINPDRESTRLFLDNQRGDVAIRYKNFSFPDKSIDYAIISSLSGRYYLILSNSRESMYSPIDKIRGVISR